MNMAWIYLFLAGLFECGWAIGLKYTEGFSKPGPSLLTGAAMAISLFLLSIAIKEIPLGTAYVIWTGIGAIGVSIFGMIILGESKETARILCLLIITTGIVGLKLISSSTGASSLR